MEINYGQFFQLIKNLGFLENLSSIHICNTGTNKSASFCGDGISNVDISISGLLLCKLIIDHVNLIVIKSEFLVTQFMLIILNMFIGV